MSTLTPTVSPEKMPGKKPAEAQKKKGAFSFGQLVAALPSALRKLNPRDMWHNPVMFVVEIGAVLTTILAISEPFMGGAQESGGAPVPPSFTWGIALRLGVT